MVVLAVLLGLLLTGMLPLRPSPASGPVASVALSQSPLGPRTATLRAASGSVAAGTDMSFTLAITGANCLTGAPPDEAVVSVVFVFGDGARLPTAGVINERSCTGAPWNETVSTSYDYIDTGTFDASAVVAWGDGYTVATNPVPISVRPANDPVGTAMSGFVIGIGIAAAATLLVVFWARRALPPPPGLRWSEI